MSVHNLTHSAMHSYSYSHSLSHHSHSHSHSNLYTHTRTHTHAAMRMNLALVKLRSLQTARNEGFINTDEHGAAKKKLFQKYSGLEALQLAAAARQVLKARTHRPSITTRPVNQGLQSHDASRGIGHARTTQPVTPLSTVALTKEPSCTHLQRLRLLAGLLPNRRLATVTLGRRRQQRGLHVRANATGNRQVVVMGEGRRRP